MVICEAGTGKRVIRPLSPFFPFWAWSFSNRFDPHAQPFLSGLVSPVPSPVGLCSRIALGSLWSVTVFPLSSAGHDVSPEEIRSGPPCLVFQLTGGYKLTLVLVPQSSLLYLDPVQKPTKRSRALSLLYFPVTSGFRDYQNCLRFLPPPALPPSLLQTQWHLLLGVPEAAW